MLHHIIYMSRAVQPLSDPELADLLRQCRRDNARLQITGILFYSHGDIAQLIEGPAAELEALYQRIARDARHSHVRKLVDKPVAARSFQDWSMAFHRLEPGGFDELAGYLEPRRTPRAPATLDAPDALLLDLVKQAVLQPRS
ncbi:BLUF domain-containing protein [Hymenobacter sp. B81]|uniref:BLUF domain-containing protein n=1 Tax=Hymenobacter sp. B81 TaxID=3344878 RepID=UPI0037DC03A8